jgi:GNAT superfamily N-acetyltransferase
MRIEYLADYPLHLRWQRTQFGYITPTTTLEDRGERLRRSLQKDAFPMALIALSANGTLLGSAGILRATITHKHLTPWLFSVYVPEEFRGQGIASALSLRAIDEAARLGFERLYLFTPQNESLYARIGWRTFERIEYSGLPLILMERHTAAVGSAL